MKKFVVLCLALTLGVAMTACTRNNAPNVTPTPTPASPSPSVSPVPGATVPPTNSAAPESTYNADGNGTVEENGKTEKRAPNNGGPVGNVGNAAGDLVEGAGNAVGDTARGIGNAARDLTGAR